MMKHRPPLRLDGAIWTLVPGDDGGLALIIIHGGDAYRLDMTAAEARAMAEDLGAAVAPGPVPVRAHSKVFVEEAAPSQGGAT